MEKDEDATPVALPGLRQEAYLRNVKRVWGFVVPRTAEYDMKKRSETTTVPGGWITRDAASGRFVAVGTGKGVDKASPKSRTVAKEISSRRSAAMKRLADR